MEEDATSKNPSKSLISDFTLLYKASFLKEGSNLFATRDAFEARIKKVLVSWPRKFAFRCCGCQRFFPNADKLSSHNSRWCQMQVITCITTFITIIIIKQRNFVYLVVSILQLPH